MKEKELAFDKKLNKILNEKVGDSTKKIDDIIANLIAISVGHTDGKQPVPTHTQLDAIKFIVERLAGKQTSKVEIDNSIKEAPEIKININGYEQDG